MNQCLYESIHGEYPHCSGACKKGKDNYCPYYFVDEICKILNDWRLEAHVDSPLLTSYNYKKKKLIIYTLKPGYLIGYHGERYEKYKKLLAEHLRFRFTDENGTPTGDDFIEFVECDDVIGA